MTTELWALTVDQLGQGYRSGAFTPAEVLIQLQERIETINPVLNAYVAFAPDVQEQAEASGKRWRAGEPLSALDGIPLAIKDNLAVAGMPATWGSAVFAADVCAADELPVARLRKAGAVIVGKTNTPEFAVEGYTGNALFGVTGNPWNPSLTPGGSSGGSVAAVAAGLACIAIGTDGGGSIRRPAGHTGLYGLKPTIGSVARAGGLPQVLLDFEVVGPVARSAGDLRHAYDILQGSDQSDPASRFVPRRRDGQRQLRILYVETFAGQPCDPQIRASVSAAADRLEALGHTVSRGELPFDLAELNAFWPKFGQIGLAHLKATDPRMSKASAKYLDIAEQGAAVPASELFAALECVRNLRADATRAFAEWDIIMTPTAAAQPWPAGEGFPPMIDGQTVGPRGHAIYTGWVNACGHPAIPLPARPDSDGMPIGFQLVGDLFTEDQLLDLAAVWERLGEGWRWPAIARA